MLKIRKAPFRIQGDGWAAGIGVFCGEKWYRPSSWIAYSSPLVARLNEWDGFSVGPILFWKES